MSNAAASRGGDVKGPRHRKSNLLAASISDGIIRAGLRPGDRLPNESEMIESYAVGRGTLREALRLLEAQGIVEIRVGSGGGSFVASPQPHSLARVLSVLLRLSDVTLREVLEARKIIEPALAAQAAVNRDESHLAQLRDNVAAFRGATRGTDEWRTLNRQFHSLLAEAAQNRPLSTLWAALSSIADGHEAGVRFPTALLGDAERAHDRIRQYVEDRDADRAAAAMTEHLNAATDHVRTFYRHLFDGAVQMLEDV